jgi:nucleotide-binding universal stress UspA family protein
MTNILLAIDGSSSSAAAVEAVVDEFRPDDTAVRVLHVIAWPRELPAYFMFSDGAHAADSVLAAHDAIRERAANLVATAVRRVERALFTASGHVVEGDPCTEILAMAREWPATMIVLGSRLHSGLDRLLGSVSSGVLRHARCSVHVVRTDAPVAPGHLHSVTKA